MPQWVSTNRSLRCVTLFCCTRMSVFSNIININSYSNLLKRCAHVDVGLRSERHAIGKVFPLNWNTRRSETISLGITYFVAHRCGQKHPPPVLLLLCCFAFSLFSLLFGVQSRPVIGKPNFENHVSRWRLRDDERTNVVQYNATQTTA